MPNGNVASWLQIRQFASEPSLCAGLEFPFLEKRLFELQKEGLPAEERSDVELLPDRSYARAIVSILSASAAEQPEYAKLAPFRAYVGAGEKGWFFAKVCNSVCIVSERLRALANKEDLLGLTDEAVRRAVLFMGKGGPFALNGEQQQAVKSVSRRRFTVVTVRECAGRFAERRESSAAEPSDRLHGHHPREKRAVLLGTETSIDQALARKLVRDTGLAVGN